MKLLLLLSSFPLSLILLLIPRSVGKDISTDPKEGDSKVFDAHHKPSTEYEQCRRRIKRNLIEFWHLFSSELDIIQVSVKKYSPELAVRMVTVIQMGREYRIALQSDLEGLRMTDGYSTWRDREAAELTELVQNRLVHLQNPKDCNVAPKAFAPFFVVEGFGYELHFLVYRFIIAYATQRTMIVASRDWLSDGRGWENHFLPFSDTCTDANGTSFAEWPLVDDPGILYLPAFSPLLPSAPFFPRTLPADLAPRLERLHGNPFAWWVGQFLKYMFRPQNPLTNLGEEITKRGKIKKPFVGVHIPKTEQNTIPIEEYMAEVEDYYEVLELTQTIPVRRIYIASDNRGIIWETIEKYAYRYEIIFNEYVPSNRDSYDPRYDSVSLMALTYDMLILSLSDHLVCTFSSHVCRAAYELMQMFHADASHRVSSMRRKYFYECELDGNLTSIYPHRPGNSGEINLNVNDEVTEVSDLKNGYSFGINRRSNEAGLYPSFKVDEIVNTFEFPTYPDIT